MNTTDISKLHHDICALVRVGQQTDLALAKCLASMACDKRYRQCGAASMSDYIRHHVNVGEGKAHGLLAIGRKLEALPELAEAMENPDIGWTKVRQVARVAEPDTVDGWLTAAATFTSRELEAATRGVAAGDEAPTPADRPRLQSRPVTFNLTPEEEEHLSRVLSFRRAAMGEAAADLSHEQVLLAALDRSMLADADQIGVSLPRLQTIIQVCPSCDDAVQAGLADGAVAEVSETTRARACCDSHQINMRTGREGDGSNTISDAMRRRVFARYGYRCAAPKCRNSTWLEVHHIVHRADSGTNAYLNLACLCSQHHGLHHEGKLGIELDTHGNAVFDY
ncbi:MAG: hypothetical protein ACI9OJ_003918, partial [Myxococcota bacterium]